jgi:hypothetical protein
LMIINWPNLSIFNTWSLCRVRVLIIFSFVPPFPSKLAQNVRWWKNKLIGSNNIYIYISECPYILFSLIVAYHYITFFLICYISIRDLSVIYLLI